MRATILGCVAGLLLWSTACAQQVEFPLDYYSFEEIAQRMSVEGRRVDCARELRQRLALVRLKPRSWQQVRDILESALDIRLRRISESENRWILERNPEVVRQERRWRERLAAFLEKQCDRDIRLFRQMLDKNVPVDELVRAFIEEYSQEDTPENLLREALEKQIRQGIQALREVPVDLALREWRAFKRLERELLEYLRTAPITDGNPFSFYQRFARERSLSSFGFSQELLDWARRVAQERNGVLKSLHAMMGGEANFPFDDPLAAQVVLLSMLGGFAQGYGQAWARDGLVRQLRPPLSALEAIEQGVVMREYLVALPPEQLAWHLNDVEGKLVPMNSTAPIQVPLLGVAYWSGRGYARSYEFPTQPSESEAIVFTPNAGMISEYASVYWDRRRIQRTLEQIDPDLLRAYTKALETHNQLVNQPLLNQPIKTVQGSHATLAEVVYRWAQEHKQEVVMEVVEVRGAENQVSTGSLAQRLQSEALPYLLEQRDGVWMVRCWAAFVERVADYPYTAIRNLLRSDFSYEAWRAFYNAVSPEQARWLMARNEWLAWNPGEKPRKPLPVSSSSELGTAWLIMLILESLPADLRQRLWNPPADDGIEPSIALTQLPLETRTRLLQILTQWRAALLAQNRLERQERFSPPSAWLERLTLVRTSPSRWELRLTVPQPSDPEKAFYALLHSKLPGNPLVSDSEERTEPMSGKEEQ